ncbi:2,3-diaminopropionate biosynthesis protein SbnA [Saccharomonospora cyanea]|uniref:N-(2-amino-2-carboxyethyl)-L-glutamate synthase n=1 Tax=Saccharomonospora cyanea NA-134 TaxID=882082 RepID=H5XI18_9PSEU|nr:2,3-diaminopropionate biosynthesis protein SbnA [Saccharomonospora cyanea]EHR60648.1 2,3-diaminopropionate biosynthesis protein SbnA [Saccharomonospora cyanea NA-134]
MTDHVRRGILATVGSTPLVELERLSIDCDMRVFAKVEKFNPGGSIKDRTAVSMLLDRLYTGQLDPGRSVVVESSSGNLAIGLAQLCRYFGLRFVCVVDARTTSHNVSVLRAYGAEVEVVTEPDPVTGELLAARLRRVEELLDELPDAFWPNQYANPRNPKAHERTMREIATALNDRVDYLFCPTGTTGTLQGCARYVRAHGLSTTIVGVDAVGSVLFDPDPPPVSRLVPGHGASVRPALLDPSAAHRVVHVDDLDCVVGCRRLVAREAILAGGSSGAAVSALHRLAPSLPPGSTCVLILPDGGDRYLDTVYSDQWVREHFGDVTHHWRDPAVARI